MLRIEAPTPLLLTDAKVRGIEIALTVHQVSLKTLEVCLWVFLNSFKINQSSQINEVFRGRVLDSIK